MKIIFSTLLFGTIVLSTFAQEPDLSKLQISQKGQRVLSYFSAFNSGSEEKLKIFFLENVAAEALKQRPVEPRLEFHRMLRENHQSINIKKIVSIEEGEIKLLVQDKKGQLIEYSFLFEINEPNKMLGWQIEPINPPDMVENSNLPPPTNNAELLSTIEKYLNQEASNDKFSGVVFIAKNDKPIFFNAYGMADKENKLPNKLQTKFNLGSINKNFTRVAIGQLVQQGKISFDDKLGKYLPDYPNKEATEKVRIRHLVNMTSGIGDFFGTKFITTPKENFRTNSDFIPLFANNSLAFEPGTKEQYSNGGYVLLGAIIEKVSGQSYYDYVKESIFNVAGMTNTDSFETNKMPDNTAIGYTKSNLQSNWMSNVKFRPFRGSAAGGGYSNAEDLLKYSIALKSRKLTIPDDNGQPQNEVIFGIAGGSEGVNALLIVNEKQDTQLSFYLIMMNQAQKKQVSRFGIGSNK